MAFKIFIWSLLLLLSSSLYAQNFNKFNDSIPSFDEISEYRTSVSNKNEVSLLEAPGSVTVYSQRDIQQLGYYTLRDLANITAGYSSFRGIGEITFETRGQKADGFDNNKHLVLIDGIPISHTRANKANAEEDLPLLFAKRVEFLKGPGSALYGISAFSGVINILSKDLVQNGTHADVKISFGNYDFKKRLMANIIHKDNQGTTKLMIGYFGKDATRDFLGNGTTPNTNSLNYDNRTAIFMNASYQIDSTFLKGTTLGFMYSRKSGGLGEFWMAQQSQNYEFNEITWEQIIPYLKYERTIFRNIYLKSYIKGNISTEKAYVGGWQKTFHNGNDQILSAYNLRVNDFEGSLEGTYKLSKTLNIILGGNFVSRKSTGNPESYAYLVSANPGTVFTPDTNFYRQSSTYNTYSVYSQLNYKIPFLYGTIITAGARIDAGLVFSAINGEVTNEYDNISPRIAVVQRISHNLSVKLMYGTALRAPLIKEVGLNEDAKQTALRDGKTDVANQIPNLDAETIQSFEGAIFYGSKKFGGNITAFYNHTKNAIGQTAIEGLAGNINTNITGDIKTTGVEAELHYILKERIRFATNYAYAHAVANDTSDTYNVPTSKINGIISYRSKHRSHLSVSLIGKMITNYRKGGQTAWGNYNNELYGGHTLFDVNVSGQVTSAIQLELQVLNLLNTEYRTPAFYASGELNVPGASRSFLGTITIKF